MEPTEHERWKRHLEEELEAAFDLVRAGFRAQMRVLDQVRVAAPPSRGAVKRAEDPPRPAQPPVPAAPGPSPLPFPPPTPGPNSAVPAARKRRPGGELLEQIYEALEGLPELFDRSDLLATLKPRPKPSSLYAMLQLLEREGRIELVERGRGTQPSRFRQLEVPDDEAEEG